MKLVIHISDPHFGTQDPRVAEALLDELEELGAACIAISGDVTQRARRAQFRQARAWLDRLSAPTIVVPGNHDIPLYDVYRRFFRPRERFHRYITDEAYPCHVDDELVVVGVDTTKSLTTKHGEIRDEQIERVVELIAAYPRHWTMLVAHHPFHVPEHSAEPTVDRAGVALARFRQAKLDMIITGHLHLRHFDGVAGRDEEHTIVNVHAGTSMSTRLRGEANGYNQLWFDGDEVAIVHREWDGRQFVDAGRKYYRRSPTGEHIVKVAEVPPSADHAPR
jgi:3',5'-cyclic AMP phosphodiesterase CpdA